jgi:hypothetical protein
MADNHPSTRPDRERLERELLERLRAAEKNYCAAVAECDHARKRYGGMADNAHALGRASENERIAVEAYSRALKAFTDLVVHRRVPRASGE